MPHRFAARLGAVRPGWEVSNRWRVAPSAPVGLMLGGLLPIAAAIASTGCEDNTTFDEAVLDDAKTWVDPSWINELLDTDSDKPAGFYSYVNEQGRTVYVSHEGLIPPRFRDQSSAVDLSHVTLNHELGSELDAAAEREHKALAKSPLCQETRQEAEAGLLHHALSEYPHWLGIGAAVLLLLFTAPAVSRRVGAAQWIRVLAMSVPLLLFLGVMTHTAREVSATLEDLQLASDLCAEDRLLEETTTAGRLSVVQQLRQKLVQIHRDREARIEEIFSETRRSSP